MTIPNMSFVGDVLEEGSELLGEGVRSVQEAVTGGNGELPMNGTTGYDFGSPVGSTSRLDAVKNASIGSSIGGVAMMAIGGALIVKGGKATAAQKRKPKHTLMRAGAIAMLSAGAAIAVTGGAVYAGSKALESNMALKSLVG